ncbi:MAG TPA: hypothetical protein VGR71_11735 [Nitrospira sp.]|nr:hypothetical protein [Nitrospira sp.]
MALAVVKTVKRAQKDQGECAKCKTKLPAGSPYRYYRPGFRSRSKVRLCLSATCTPRRSELETSKLADAYAAIEDTETVIAEATDIDSVTDAVNECASRIRDLSEEYEQSIENAPMLEDTVREKIELLDSFADDLESFEPDEETEQPEEPRRPNRQDFDSDDAFNEALGPFQDELEDYQRELEEWKQECSQALDDAKGGASDILAGAEF